MYACMYFVFYIASMAPFGEKTLSMCLEPRLQSFSHPKTFLT